MKFPKKNSSAIILLMFCFINSFGQSDSRGMEYMKIGNEFKKKEMPDSAVVYYEKASKEFEAPENTTKWINAYNQIGIILTRQDQYDKAKHYLDMALEKGIATLEENNLLLATTYISLGVVYSAQEEYAKSLEHL